jgi:hypothetical protein
MCGFIAGPGSLKITQPVSSKVCDFDQILLLALPDNSTRSVVAGDF